MADEQLRLTVEPAKPAKKPEKKKAKPKREGKARYGMCADCGRDRMYFGVLCVVCGEKAIAEGRLK